MHVCMYNAFSHSHVALSQLDIKNSVFEECSAGSSGGAVAAESSLVRVTVISSAFRACRAADSGGAVSAADGARVALRTTVLADNAVERGGGGGVYASNAPVELVGVAARGNSAPAGGGGVLLWQGRFEAKIIDWCPTGTHAPAIPCTSPGCAPHCVACSAGAFQSSEAATACILCSAGTYSNETGATTVGACAPCPAGHNSSAVGARSVDACQPCPAGTFAEEGASTCTPCSAGRFSGTVGAVRCKQCANGTYSLASAASSASSCAACPMGKYASLAGATVCVLCSAGSFSAAIGAWSASTCEGCSVGKYSQYPGATTSAACVECNAGTISLGKRFTFEVIKLSWDSAEAACVAAGGHLASIKSSVEYNLVLRAVPNGMDWWIGLRYSADTGLWTWSDTGLEPTYTAWGAANPKLGALHQACSVMPSYSYSADPGPSSSLDAPWPFYIPEFDLVPPSSSLSSPEGAWYNIQCADRVAWINGYICSFTGATSCLSCAAGTFSSSAQTAACETCPAGTYSNSTGATQCIACADGTFATGPGATACLPSSNRRAASNYKAAINVSASQAKSFR
jgi:hypothetical protein